MRDWLAELAGPQYVEAILWTLGALAALVVLLLIIRLARGIGGGTFVAGGRNRKTRLAVMDATAVDTHRRLVLVRRDDVEHLILIGGPTDVVVEANIRLTQRRPVPTPTDIATQAEPASLRPAAEPASLRPAVDPTRAAEPARPAARVEAAAPPTRGGRPEPVFDASPVAALSPTAPRPMEASAPPTRRASDVRPPEARASAPPAEPRPSTPPLRVAVPAPQPVPQAVPVHASDDMDDALMRELEVSFEKIEPPLPRSGAAGSASLDDEMTRLLGELSGRKR